MTTRARQMMLALLAIIAGALAPVLSVLISMGVAERFGCVLNEADSHPCVILGMDFGGLLGAMFVMGWFALATVPLGTIALLVWIVAAAVLYFRSRRAS